MLEGQSWRKPLHKREREQVERLGLITGMGARKDHLRVTIRSFHKECRYRVYHIKCSAGRHEEAWRPRSRSVQGKANVKVLAEIKILKNIQCLFHINFFCNNDVFLWANTSRTRRRLSFLSA
jgi:hypothetical protein